MELGVGSAIHGDDFDFARNDVQKGAQRGAGETSDSVTETFVLGVWIGGGLTVNPELGLLAGPARQSVHPLVRVIEPHVEVTQEVGHCSPRSVQVDLEISRIGPSGPWEDIATCIENDGIVRSVRRFL